MPSAMLHTLTPTVRIPITSIVAAQSPPPTSIQQLTCPPQTPHPRTLKQSTPSGSPKAGRAVERATAFIRLPVAISGTESEQKSHSLAQGSQRPFVSQTLAEIVTKTVFLVTSATNAENRTLGQTEMLPRITPRSRLFGPSRRQVPQNIPR
jgi:primosomal replication protein N